MADATTLDQLYDAVFAAVRELGAGEGNAGSFREVVEFGGELTPETVSQAVSNRLPAALVALAGENVGGSDAYETTDGEMQVTTEAQVTVYVVVQSIRGARAAHDGAGGAKGLFALCSEVIGAVNGLRHDGLWGNGYVRYARLRPAFFRPGNTGASCAYAVSFVAERVAEQRAPEVAGVPFARFEGVVHAADEAETPVANAAVDLPQDE